MCPKYKSTSRSAFLCVKRVKAISSQPILKTAPSSSHLYQRKKTNQTTALASPFTKERLRKYSRIQREFIPSTSPFIKEELRRPSRISRGSTTSPFIKGGLRGIFFEAWNELGKMHQLFGVQMEGLIEELHGELVA